MDWTDWTLLPIEAESLGLLHPLAGALHILLFFMVSLHCLYRRREASSALLWIFLAWMLPVVGPLLYLFFGIYRVPLKAWHKKEAEQEFLQERRALEEDALPLAYWRAVHEGEATEPDTPLGRDLNHAMDQFLKEDPLLGGNAITPLVGGEEAYPLMLDSIRAARHHIHLQTFILGADEVGRRFMDLLAAKAREGVTVRLMYDSFGSTYAILRFFFRQYRHIPNLRLVPWTQSNVLKRRFQVNLRNHRKVLIVDGREAFTGGLNLARNNLEHKGTPAIRDYHFHLRGPIVQELQYAFLRDWNFMTDDDPGTLLHAQHFPHLEPVAKAKIRVVNSGPSSALETITDVIFAMIVSARRQLIAVTPYFVPTPDILRALRFAALRGVDVRLIVPARSNHIYAGLAGQALYEELLEAGVRIFERRSPFMHAKALLVDDEVALVGTANLDVRSLRLNYETNLVVFDAACINALKRIVLEDLAMSDPLTLPVWRQRPLYRRWLENFCNLLTPIL